ncbi:MAG: bifunctional DNA primase/polymerase [Anaerolineales bacterium]|nr:CHC2 zinc finger domain-containing protein [Anaerolineales bacterium]NUQ58233.1 bifunctional DNA primase/polymerase [Anaerolineales bacterium]
MTLEMYTSALDWLGRGFSLLPIRPGTKYKAMGYGVHQMRIMDQQIAAQYFRDSSMRWNLGVVAPQGKIILDFDDWDLYIRWVKFVKRFDDSMVRTYTELTPGGGVHVFLSGDLPLGYKCRKGVEIKGDVVVAPSVVGGCRYEVFAELPIYHGSLDAVFYYLKEPCPDRGALVVSEMRSLLNQDGKIANIKGRMSIVEMMKKYYPSVKLIRRGYFHNSLCPFHAEKNPSFWLNEKLNTFGCHACGARGDIINFYALVKNITNDQAVKDLMMLYA